MARRNFRLARQIELAQPPALAPFAQKRPDRWQCCRHNFDVNANRAARPLPPK
jgi:hypothetical protein